MAALGERAAAVLREDPWAVLALPGVRPDQADGFARGLLSAAGEETSPGDPRRAQALTVHLLERAALFGHTAAELTELRAGLAKLGVPSPEEALAEVLADGRVMAFREEEDEEDFEEEGAERGPEPGAAAPGGSGGGSDAPVYIALDRYALAEESLADGLIRLRSTFEPPAAEEAESWAKAAGEAPSPSAGDLIRAAAGNGLVLHTGGEAARAEPLALVRAARALGLRAWLAVANEDGLRRVDPAAGAEASDGASAEAGAGAVAVTVRALMDGSAGPGRAEDGSLDLDLLAVCDAPTLDVESAATLVEAVPDGARLVLSGDPGELWSAGPGRVFADLLAARPCPVVASRTPDFGPIGELVSGIGVGELLPVEAPGKEVVIVSVGDPGEAVHRTVQLVQDSIPRALGIPAGQVRVLTLGHGGPVGTRALNAALKERLNPGPGRFGGFDPGDAVVHSPVPGDARPALVRTATPEGLLVAGADGTEYTVPREQVEAGKVRHGWALTVHQAAARRWPGVVAVLPGDAGSTLTRQLVYTAFGRAERHLSVVQGAGPVLAEAVANRPAAPRTTRLDTLLTGLLAQLTEEPGEA